MKIFQVYHSKEKEKKDSCTNNNIVKNKEIFLRKKEKREIKIKRIRW